MGFLEFLKRFVGLSGTEDTTVTDPTSDGIESPELYLKLTTECMTEVQEMNTPRVSTESPKFNSEQCVYLAVKLQRAVESARSFLSEQSPTSLESKEMPKYLETFKLLFASAKQVQSFIQICGKLDAYSLAAVILPNVTEHNSSVDFDLELCRIVFSGSKNWEATQNATLNGSSFDERKASLDKKTLLRNLKALSRSNIQVEERLLATFVLERLERPIQGSSRESRVFEVAPRSLHRKEKLGSGATCDVYKAIWLGVAVAMKIFIGSDPPTFKKEVVMLAGLSHRNVLSLLCFSSMANHWCAIVTELMDADLFSLIQSRLQKLHECGTHDSAPFSDLETVHLILQIAEGMLYLHRNKIVHRDLKSKNILVKYVKATEMDIGYAHVKVADFGLSKIKESSTTQSLQTTNVGTGRWMAPEMIRFQDGGDTFTRLVYDPFKADIYSFSMVCYEILTGYLPFPTTSNEKEVKRKVLRGERPIWPKQGLEKLKALVEKCWSQEAYTRPSFDVIHAELRHLKYSLATVNDSTMASSGSTCQDDLRSCEEQSIPGGGPQMQGQSSQWEELPMLVSSMLPGVETILEASESRFQDIGQPSVGIGSFANYLKQLSLEIDTLTTLTTLGMDGCSSLEYLPEDVGNMRTLTTLILDGCSSLKKLPNSIGNLTALTTLSLNGCSSLTWLPENVGNLRALTTLCLANCLALGSLPWTIVNLTALTTLSLDGCSSLEQLMIVGTLIALTTLSLDGCSSLKELPQIVGTCTTLTTLRLDGCSSLKDLPDEIANLEALTTLSLNGTFLRQLPVGIGYLIALTTLSLDGCSWLEQLPCEIGTLVALTTLILNGCSELERLPHEIGNLTALTNLSLNGCKGLEQLPDEIANFKALTTLSLNGTFLRQLPLGIGNLVALTTLSFDGCSELRQLPREIGNLTALTTLSLDGCKSLKQLPFEIGNLMGLTKLSLNGCKSLMELPSEFGNLIALTTLSLERLTFVQLSNAIVKLANLTTLRLDGCWRLQQLPREIGNLTALTTLSLDGCSSLKQLPYEIANLTALTKLSVNGCSSLTQIPREVRNLTALTF